MMVVVRENKKVKNKKIEEGIMGDEYCKKCKSKLATCPTCKGKGMTYQGGILGGSNKSCPNCKGTGKLCPKHGNDWG